MDRWLAYLAFIRVEEIRLRWKEQILRANGKLSADEKAEDDRQRHKAAEFLAAAEGGTRAAP